jgi:hypothetical protein
MRTGEPAVLLKLSQRIVRGASRTASTYRSGVRSAMCGTPASGSASGDVKRWVPNIGNSR